jgi:hypothetical protein
MQFGVFSIKYDWHFAVAALNAMFQGHRMYREKAPPLTGP